MCANPVQINKWFHLYQQLLQDLQLDYKPNNVWNIDESGLHDIPDEEQVIETSRILLYRFASM